MAAIALSHRQDIAAFSMAGEAENSAFPRSEHTPSAMTASDAAGFAPIASDPSAPDSSAFDRSAFDPPASGAPSDIPPELLSDLAPATVPDRDDRGPLAPPEPREYTLPPEPAAVSDAPALAPGEPAEASQAATIPEDIESVAARRLRRPPARRQQKRAGSTRWSIAILALLAINLGLIGWRTDIVRLMPQTASLYAAIGLDVNLRNLHFTDLVTRKESQDGVHLLVVEGNIKSTNKRPTEVPRLRFAVQNAKGHDIYSWTALPTNNVIAPGAVMPFRSRLASPPPDTQAVLVRFFNRRDLVAGVQ
jgi:hypothetical protein